MDLVPRAPQPLKGCPWSTSSELTRVLVSLPACGKGKRGVGELPAFLSETTAHNNLCSQRSQAALVQAALFSCVPWEQPP